MSFEAGRFCMNCMSASDSTDVCPECGHDNSGGNHNDLTCLQPGDIVAARYVIGMNKKRGGEVSEYIGRDMEAGHTVLIKEYFPRSIAERSHDGSIVPKSGRGAQYKALMSEFVDLCNAVRRLSVSDAVIPIEHMVSGNNTIYAIYKSVDSICLEDYLSTPKVKAAGGKLPVRRALKMFAPIFDTLINMHARGDIHRGISPYTVYIGRDGKLYLSDFALSASRTDGCELDAELFDGYSAPEQYASNGWQGEWTDVYAAAALFYRVVTDIAPPKATMIGPARPITPLKDILKDDIPPGISEAVENAMQPLKAKRTQTIAAFAAKMSVNENFADTAATAVFEISKAARPPSEERESDKSSGQIRQNRRKKDSEGGVSVKYVILALFFTVLVLAGSMWFVMTRYFPDLISAPAASSRPSQSQSSIPSSDKSSEDESSEQSQEDDKSIPNFIGKTAETVAGDEAYADRFKFELRPEFDNRYEAGVIFEQAPPAGEIMRNKGTVILFVSKGKLEVTMPDLKDKTVEEAMEIFNDLGKEYGVDYLSFQTIEKYDSEIEGGHIISSIPTAETVFDPKTTQVIVYVSLTVEVSETKEESSSRRSSSSRMEWQND